MKKNMVLLSIAFLGFFGFANANSQKYSDIAATIPPHSIALIAGTALYATVRLPTLAAKAGAAFAGSVCTLLAYGRYYKE